MKRNYEVWCKVVLKFYQDVFYNHCCAKKNHSEPQLPEEVELVKALKGPHLIPNLVLSIPGTFLWDENSRQGQVVIGEKFNPTGDGQVSSNTVEKDPIIQLILGVGSKRGRCRRAYHA